MVNHIFYSLITFTTFMRLLQTNFTKPRITLGALQPILDFEQQLPTIRLRTKPVIGVEFLLVFLPEVDIPLILLLSYQSADVIRGYLLSTVVFRASDVVGP